MSLVQRVTLIYRRPGMDTRWSKDVAERNSRERRSKFCLSHCKSGARAGHQERDKSVQEEATDGREDDTE